MAERLVDAVYQDGAVTADGVQRAIELYREELRQAVARHVVRAGEALVKGGELYL
jgi:hypothetical protein